MYTVVYYTRRCHHRGCVIIKWIKVHRVTFRLLLPVLWRHRCALRSAATWKVVTPPPSAPLPLWRSRAYKPPTRKELRLSEAPRLGLLSTFVIFFVFNHLFLLSRGNWDTSDMLIKELWVPQHSGYVSARHAAVKPLKTSHRALGRKPPRPPAVFPNATSFVLRVVEVVAASHWVVWTS